MSLNAVSTVHKTTPNRFTVLTRGTLADDTQHTFNCLSIKAKCTWQSKQSINDRMLKMWSKVKRNWVLLDKQADIWTLAFPFYFFLSFWWLYCFKPFVSVDGRDVRCYYYNTQITRVHPKKHFTYKILKNLDAHLLQWWGHTHTNAKLVYTLEQVKTWKYMLQHMDKYAFIRVHGPCKYKHGNLHTRAHIHILEHIDWRNSWTLPLPPTQSILMHGMHGTNGHTHT